MAFRTNKMPVLQEKSASGAVASFNTALAMPLVNGEFSIQAYQEGSGDPSPVNVRNIIPWREVNITHTHKNLCNESEFIGRKAIGEYGELVDNAGYKSSQLIPIKDNITLYLSSPNLNERTEGAFIAVMRFAFYDRSGNFISRTSALYGTVVNARTPINTCFVRFQCGYFAEEVQLEVGSTATDYEPYIVPEVKTVALGEDVYGGSYNSVTGVMRVEWIKKVINETSGVSLASNGILYRDNFFDIPEDTMSVKCNCYTRGTNRSNVAQTMQLNPNYSFCCKTGGTPNRVMIKDTRFNTLEEFNEWVALNPISVLIMLAEPFEVQLDPTPINTFNGDNNIFCDTGDTSLVYKDLDIAKRGNFREVFKLPS